MEEDKEPTQEQLDALGITLEKFLYLKECFHFERNKACLEWLERE